MSIKTRAPKEDPETKARREAAEARADASRIEEAQTQLSEETRAVIRQFGRLASFSGQGSLVPKPSPLPFKSGLVDAAARNPKLNYKTLAGL